MAEAVWCGPGAARVLAGGGGGSVVAAFGGGGYLRLPGGFVLLAPAGSPRGPLTLIVERLRPPAVPMPATITAHPPAVPMPATISAHPPTLIVGGAAISLARLPIAACPVRPVRTAGSSAVLAARSALAVVARAPAALQPGLSALARGSWIDGVRGLAGLGEGLTPAGDDVLAGHGAWRWATGAPVAVDALAVGRCSPIGLAYLRCAARGELPRFFDGVLRAVAAGDAAAAALWATRARAWGASSGAALVWGLAAGAAGLGLGGDAERLPEAA
jgi:hypothetical protein